MRPVKKALKALDSAHHNMPPEEFAVHRKECVLKIGMHIDDCLDEHRDPLKIKEWRSNLWYFVSKFTEDNASKLFKLYKSVKANENGSESPAKSEKKEKHHHHKSHDHHHDGMTVESKKRDKKNRELKHKTDHDLHEKYKTFDPEDPYGEVYSGKRRLEREDGEIDDSKEYKRMSGDAR